MVGRGRWRPAPDGRRRGGRAGRGRWRPAPDGRRRGRVRDGRRPEQGHAAAGGHRLGGVLLGVRGRGGGRLRGPGGRPGAAAQGAPPLAFAIAGLVYVFVGLSYTEMAAAYPVPGGGQYFTLRGLGDR